jgi:hypothetical protein
LAYQTKIMKQNNPQFTNLGRYYMSQGITPQNVPTNDCGPTSVAMVINLIQEQSGIRNKKVFKNEVIAAIPFFGHLPNWIQNIGGASAPWGLVKAFNHLAHRNQLPWDARRVSHASTVLLSKILMKSGYLSILRVWKNGGAHWLNVVHLDRKKGLIYLLDPNPYLARLPVSKKVQIEDWKTFKSDWERQPLWAKLLGIKRELIAYQSTKN